MTMHRTVWCWGGSAPCRRQCWRATSMGSTGFCILSCWPSALTGNWLTRPWTSKRTAQALFEIAELIEEEIRLKVVDETALTFVVLAIKGTINGADVSGRYRYTRTWTRAAGEWQVVGAHISPAA
jgi:Domain of unknown function (DUF4440)